MIDSAFRQLADCLPHLVWTMNGEGLCLFKNAGWASYSGRQDGENDENDQNKDGEDGEDGDWLSLVHPDDVAWIRRAWADTDRCQPFEHACRLRRADGTYRWMSARVVPHDRDPADHWVALEWLGTFTDIDALKQSEIRLDRELSMLSTAGRVAQMGGWRIDLPERSLFWTDENCAIHDLPAGYKPTLDEGVNYFFPEDRAEVLRHVAACEEYGTPYEFILRKRTAKGRQIWVHSYGEAVHDDNGRIVALRGAFQDITRRRAEQDQLRLLEKAVSRLNDIVVILEAEPLDASGPRIVFVNDAFERITGYSRSEAIGRTPGFVGALQTDPAELQRIQHAMQDCKPVRAEVAINTRQGQRLWLEIDLAPITDDAGTFTNWVAVERDVTERRQQRQEILRLNSDLELRVLQRTAQLGTANREMESFAHSVSHDLRQPLNAIAAWTGLLRQSESQSLRPKGIHYLDRIEAGVSHMGALIDGLLALSSLSHGPVLREAVDMSMMARRLDEDMREAAPGKPPDVTIGDDLVASGDPRLLSVVLQNLLANAWKFSAGGESARVEFGCTVGEDGERVFHVKDNGAGFDMAHSGRLFGVFEKLHPQEDFPGTGIGLATVKRVIERHGGRVWAEGVVGVGANFYFTLGQDAMD